MLKEEQASNKITIIKNKNKSKYKNWTSQGHFSGGAQISLTTIPGTLRPFIQWLYKIHYTEGQT